MCAIVAVLRRAPGRLPPDAAGLLAGLVEAVRVGPSPDGIGAMADPGPLTVRLAAAAEILEGVDLQLRGVPGVQALLAHPEVADAVRRETAAVGAGIRALEEELESGRSGLAGAGLEQLNAGLVRLKDATWALARDRLRTPPAVADLAGTTSGPAALAAFTSIQVALSALDRLEVRGRDSAGLHLLVTGHGLDLDDPGVRRLLAGRLDDPLFGSRAVRTPAGHLSFVYKAAAEVGELGDNTRALRAQIRADELLHRALASPSAEAAVLAHTRWASVGIISEANAHPVNSDELDEALGGRRPYVVAAANGDVDNHAELRSAEDLRVAREITTDAKVIPTLVARRLAAGQPPASAFRSSVASFAGSLATAAQVAQDPHRILLSVRGSGQGLYVGLAEDAYVVASEPYGLVEETLRYLRVDGESTAAGASGPGQVFTLDATRAGTLEGVSRVSYDGTPLPLADRDVHSAEITTRDIDRGGFRHFLLKEISEAPQSWRKTLRGKIVEQDGRLSVAVGDDALPPPVRARLRSGVFRRCFVIGQGTAAVAGQSVAASLAEVLAGTGVTVAAVPAAELSGFGMDDDMSDALVVAVSQSGTTTDTNRTVDLVRARGATVVAIVNRRNSDLVEKSDGVLYTSDGRDVEMSVASTKAFYAQVAAGALLALAVAAEAGVGKRDREHEWLEALRNLPVAMSQVLALREEVAAAAVENAPARRHWAVVGSGSNRIAAQEVRIKLSELCYKSIACDAIEDKKHIDLSSEPLILVCAAGLHGATADDTAKETAIYRAHKAAPIVVASDGERRFDGALHVLSVPPTHPSFAFVLSAMAGHLFSYEAALAIDAQAVMLREARGAVETVAMATADGQGVLERLAAAVAPAAERFLTEVRTGSVNGSLEASTAVRLASLLRYATGVLPLEAYEAEYGKVATPGALMDDLTDALTRGIEELSRPVDAIKHQAKTVTVGISRSEEALFRVGLVEQVLAAGARRSGLSYRALRALAALDPAVAEVIGWTRYRIEGSVADGPATIHVVDRSGLAAAIPSRTERDPELRGTKHRAALEREVLAAVGRSDGRTVLLVPESKGADVSGMTLLHVRFVDRLPSDVARSVLTGYRNRYDVLVDMVAETESRFDDGQLAEVPVADLLLEPLPELADRWRSG